MRRAGDGACCRMHRLGYPSAQRSVAGMDVLGDGPSIQLFRRFKLQGKLATAGRIAGGWESKKASKATWLIRSMSRKIVFPTTPPVTVS